MILNASATAGALGAVVREPSPRTCADVVGALFVCSETVLVTSVFSFHCIIEVLTSFEQVATAAFHTIAVTELKHTQNKTNHKNI